MEIPFSPEAEQGGKPTLLIYRGLDCPHCPRRGECTRSIQRTISWDPREFLLQRMRARLDTADGRRRYGKRKYLVEPVFGDMKETRHMGKLLLWGKRKAKGEFLLMCIVHNLRKMAKHLRLREREPTEVPFPV